MVVRSLGHRCYMQIDQQMRLSYTVERRTHTSGFMRITSSWLWSKSRASCRGTLGASGVILV